MTKADAFAFRPSAYTALVLRQVLAHGPRIAGGRVLDIGCGSGVLLAAAADMGAGSLCGVDIEPAAVQETARLLGALTTAARVEALHGSLYAPVAGRHFDVILANLPHFPMDHAAIDARLSSWSDGGDSGRRLLDPVLAGLGAHLAPGGLAIVAHNAFVGLEATQDIASAQGLTARVIDAMTVPIAPEKLGHMTVEVLDREMGRSLHRHGGHVFAEVLALAIEHAGDGT